MDQQIASLRDEGIQLGGLFHVARIYDPLAFRFDQERVGVPAVRAVLIQVGIVQGGDADIFVLVEKSVPDLSLNQRVGQFVYRIAAHYRQYCIQNGRARGKYTQGIVVFQGQLVAVVQLTDAAEQISESSHMIHVRMGDHDRADRCHVDPCQIARVGAALAGVKPVNGAADLHSQRAVMHARHGLRTGAGAEVCDFYHIQPPDFDLITV